MAMSTYKVGAIFTRCFIQKELAIRDGITVIPLGPTGSSDDIHATRRLLESAGFPFSRMDLEKALANFQQAGHSVLLEMTPVDAKSFQDAIDTAEKDAHSIAGALSVISANPVVPVCTFARSSADSGVKFHIPNDRIGAGVRHNSRINLDRRVGSLGLGSDICGVNLWGHLWGQVFIFDIHSSVAN